MIMRATNLLTCAAAAPLCLCAGPLFGADHREAPLIREDLSADIADVYAYLSPDDETRLVLAMTVNAFSVSSEAFSFNFSPNVQYRFQIDTTGDAVEDAFVHVGFRNQADGSQRVRFNVNGVLFSGDVTAPTEEPEPNEPIVIEGPMGILGFAGPRDDPFFFDVVGFVRFLSGTGGFEGNDGFAGFNVSAIVVEFPLALLGEGTGPLQIWGETVRRRKTVRRATTGELELHQGPPEQVERMGNPAVSTALIPAPLKDFYNIGEPENDADDFADAIVASLVALGTNEENIGILAGVAVPDTLKLDPSEVIGYPNGRDLDDDVIDTLLFFIFNQTPVSDGVDGNDAAFGDVFPYLAPPHQPR